MLKSLLNTEAIQVVEQVKDWREAVTISCRPLIGNGSIEPHYVDAIYHSHDTTSPCYMVGPGVAVPHAHSEKGANKLSLALTLIPSGVNFDADESDPVRLLIMLAATDSANHTGAISQLAKLFDNGKDIQATLTTRTTQDTLSVIAHCQF